MESTSYLDWIILFILIGFSAIFSGLTIGYMSLDKSDLERKKRLGDKYAAKVLKLRKNVNLLLCSLLFGNVAINTAIPLYLDTLMISVVKNHISPLLMNYLPEQFVTTYLSVTFVAASISIFAILFFGEIIPQAVTSRHALRIGAFFYPLMQVVIWTFWIICWPISKFLDILLGKEGQTLFEKDEFVELIKEHEDHIDSDIDEDEERIILGTLSFSDKTAKDAMTPKRQVYSVNAERKIDDSFLQEVHDSGFTRIPVYEKTEDNIVGILYSKSLIIRKESDGFLVKDIMKKDKLFTTKTIVHLDYIYNKMIAKRTHMAIVYDEHKTLRGVLTLEDIMEEIVDQEIVDETDKESYVDPKIQGHEL